jgi:hypothetical protein
LPVRPTADRGVESQPAANPKDLPDGSDVTAQTADDFDSERRLARRPVTIAPGRIQSSSEAVTATDRRDPYVAYAIVRVASELAIPFVAKHSSGAGARDDR